MRMSEATTWDKKVLTLNDIRGVDLSSAPLGVKETRASYMKNMICKDGVNHKRNGFEEIASFYDENGNPMAINGIFPYTTSNGINNVLVHVGKELYLCDEHITLDRIKLADIGAEKTKCFFCEGKIYLVSNKKLYVYDGNETVPELFNSDSAYVPTTSIGITDEKHGSLLEPYEEVNLFNTKRINKLVGSKDSDAEIWDVSNSKARYYLDGKISLSSDIKITATINTCGALQEESSMPLLANTEDGNTTGLVNITFERDKEGNGLTFTGKGELQSNNKEALKFYNPNKQDDEGKYLTVEFKAEIYNLNERGVIEFSPCLLTPQLGEDNITVEYSVYKEKPQIKEITELSVGANKMLVIATEDDVVYFSSLSEGYTYFPDNNYLKAMNDVSALISGEDFLGVASKDEIAVITFSINDDGEKILCVPSLLKKYKDIGCASTFSQANVEGDTLFLSNKGVYGISTSGIHMRSSRINKELTAYSRETLKSSFALEHEGRYYLFVDSKVYIADARYKTYESNRLDVSYEYEWWRWEDVPCKSAVVHMGKLLLGREDGRVVEQSEGYIDKLQYELESGDMTNIDGKSFILNQTLGIKATDKIKLSGGLRLIAEGIFETHLDEGIAYIEFEYPVFFDLLLKNKLANGKTLMVDIPWKGSGEKIDLTEWEFDNINQRIKFNYSSETDTNIKDAVRLYEYINDECFDLEPSKDGNYNLIDDFGEVVELLDVGSLTGILLSETLVECEVHTAVLNFRTDIKKKTLHKIVFTPSVDTVGEVSVGYETDKNEREKRQKVSGELDFNNIDFNSFSFDTAFYKTFEKRMHERNVSFVKFKFKSSGEGDFAIENFSCVYSLNSR